MRKKEKREERKDSSERAALRPFGGVNGDKFRYAYRKKNEYSIPTAPLDPSTALWAGSSPNGRIIHLERVARL
jgi:hypothetical protein